MIITFFVTHIILEICTHIKIDKDKINFMSTCQKYYELRKYVWFGSQVNFSDIKNLSYVDRFTNIIVNSDDFIIMHEANSHFRSKMPLTASLSANKLNLVMSLPVDKLTLAASLPVVKSTLAASLPVDKPTLAASLPVVKSTLVASLPTNITHLKLNIKKIAHDTKINISLESFNNIVCLTIYEKYIRTQNVHIKLPPKLKHLNLESNPYYLKRSDANIFTDSLESIYWKHDVSINYILPLNLKKLSFGSNYKDSISQNILESKIIELELGYDFNQNLGPNILPTSLQILKLSHNYNQPYHNNIYLPELKVLHMFELFNLWDKFLCTLPKLFKLVIVNYSITIHDIKKIPANINKIMIKCSIPDNILRKINPIINKN